jgi:hypothetical protein
MREKVKESEKLVDENLFAGESYFLCELIVKKLTKNYLTTLQIRNR